jgi:hypothetical protein
MQRDLSPRRWIPGGVLIAVVALVYALNPLRLREDVGDGGNGRWRDPIDSYSEYLVRNTVIHRLAGRSTDGFMVTAKGFPREDYSYYPDSMQGYYSSLTVQQRTIFALARAAGVTDERGVHALVDRLKPIAGVLLGVVLIAGVLLTARPVGTRDYFVILLMLGFSAGLVIFARNLFWVTFTYFLPLLATASLYRGRITGRLVVAYSCAVAVMLLMHYEFWPVFVLVSLLPVVTRASTNRVVLRNATALVACSVVTFCAVLTLHLAVLSHETHVSFGRAFAIIAERMRERNLSTTGVPSPLSIAAVRQLASRQVHGVAIALPGVRVPHAAISLVYVVLAWWAWRRREAVVGRILALGALAYSCWYVLGYQHIMWHIEYDRLLFASTVQLALTIALVFAMRAREGVE